MRRFSAFLLCISLFTALMGCEQEIDPSLFNVLYQNSTQSALTEQDAATHILITDESSEYYGALSAYMGKYTSTDGVF